jgi:predicted RNA binding protein YcfA (HicA-like mRNA interferase family)
MSKLQLVNAKAMEKLLLEIGFVRKRQIGSHVFYRHNDGRTTTIPFHSNKDLARPLIREIINEINMTIEDYNDLLKKI